MSLALIGHTGFVGSTLKRQAHFDHLFNSSNIQEVGRQAYGAVICAAAPAQKWIANREPEADWANIQGLIASLEKIECRHFVLISTVDVFTTPVGVDESTPVETDGLHPYGLHRRRLEQFVESRFESHLIVRLPGLVGPGLRKNILFDFHNDNNVSSIDSRSRFQFYPMVNLYSDLQAARDTDIRLLHLTSEPISVADVAHEAFNLDFNHVPGTEPALYDMRTLHVTGLDGSPGYQYDRRSTLTAIRAFHQSEPAKAIATT